MVYDPVDYPRGHYISAQLAMMYRSGNATFRLRMEAGEAIEYSYMLAAVYRTYDVDAVCLSLMELHAWSSASYLENIWQEDLEDEEALNI